MVEDAFGLADRHVADLEADGTLGDVDPVFGSSHRAGNRQAEQQKAERK